MVSSVDFFFSSVIVHTRVLKGHYALVQLVSIFSSSCKFSSIRQKPEIVVGQRRRKGGVIGWGSPSKRKFEPGSPPHALRTFQSGNIAYSAYNIDGAKYSVS